MDAKCLLQEFPLPLCLHHQLLMEALQLFKTLLDVMRRKVPTSDLQGFIQFFIHCVILKKMLSDWGHLLTKLYPASCTAWTSGARLEISCVKVWNKDTFSMWNTQKRESKCFHRYFSTKTSGMGVCMWQRAPGVCAAAAGCCSVSSHSL